jgi:hypothetical protein
MRRRTDSVLSADQARPWLFELAVWRCSSCGLVLVLAKGDGPDVYLHPRCGGFWREARAPGERTLLLRILTRRML